MNKLCIIKLILLFSITSLLSTTVYGQNDSLPAEHAKHSISLRKVYDPVPIAPFHDTLFYIRTHVGSFTAKERAKAITDRIRNFNKEFGRIQPDSMSVFVDGGLACIAYNDFIIMTITEGDAQLMGKTQLTLAHDYEEIIKNAIIQHQKNTYWLNILWRAFLVVLIVGAQYFIIKIINFAFRKISFRIDKLKGNVIKTIRFKSFVVLNEEKTMNFIHFLIRILRYAIIILMLYLSLPIIFSIFPATRNFATILIGYVATPLKAMFFSIVNYIPNLIKIILIVYIFRYIIKGLHLVAEGITQERIKIKGFYPDWGRPTFNIIRVLLYAFMFILIFPNLPGSNSPIFQGVSVFIGVIISLGSTSVINNIMSGLVLTYMRPFQIGDRIKINDVVGNVVEKTPFVIRVRTPKNEEVTIPNSGIMAAQTFNYSESARMYKLILHTTITVGYDIPWRKVHELLLNVAKQTPDVLEDPKPFILQTALDDFYVEYQLNVYVIDADKMPQIYSALRQNIQDIFRDAGIELMSPHYRAYRDGSKPAIPAP
ncbi:MAG: mechanosensitive ion channel family protein [Bacteroidetes bacterium]|nr:mechanosensitive ion channel family protein [Bacteroidota bacterium]MCL2303236.1 mechanosensitive ion channel family protein [Lentimicrobiaceae bacterium]